MSLQIQLVRGTITESVGADNREYQEEVRLQML